MKLSVYLFLILFISCQNSNKNLDTKDQSEIEENNISSFENLNNHYVHEVLFKDFKVIIDSTYIWEEYELKAPITDDSAFVKVELGETIENKNITVIQNEFDVVNVYQRFENSITIINEGPHCDLNNWKHYYSEWKLLDNKEGVFTTDFYTEEDWKKFPSININELYQAVENECGEKWSKLIQLMNNPNKIPSMVSMSSVFLKIELENTTLNKKLEKIIVFEIPMGC